MFVTCWDENVKTWPELKRLSDLSDLQGIFGIEKLTWPMAKLFSTFWDYIFSRENKPFKLFFFQGP